MLMSYYHKLRDNTIQPDIHKCLSKVEQELSKVMKRLEVRGKRGQKVAILVTNNMQETLSVLARSRGVVGLSNNRYVFPNINSSKGQPVRAADCIRKFSHECGAKSSQNLTATKMQKHVASMSQIFPRTMSVTYLQSF
jgi:hypothetical protein